jgi:hypothetical protein
MIVKSLSGSCRWTAGTFAAAIVSIPALAWGDQGAADVSAAAPLSKADCAAAFEQSQHLRNSFQYVEATEQALRCANPQCGAVLSEECGKLYGELQAATPSVVLGARAEDGTELGSVSIDVDGGSRRVAIDGTPLLINPGNHEFTFSAAGFKSTRQTAVILTGERFRPIVGVLTKDAPEPVKSAPPPERAPLAASSGGVPLASYVLGGIGLAGFAGFVGFRLAGAHDYDTLDRTCKPECAQSSVDAARQKYVLSYVGLGIGGAASIAAVTLYLVSPRKPKQQTATLRLANLPDGVAAQLAAPF